MQSVIVFLAFFRFCLEVQHVFCKICPDGYYTIVNSTGSFVRCLSCDTCPPGQGLDPPCGRQITTEQQISCVDCLSGTFSAELDSSPCENCQQCAPHQIASSNCTKSSDRTCSKTCAKGYFFVDTSHSCEKCSYCCFDNKDEPQQECTKQGFNVTGQYCRIRLDKSCAPHLTTGTTLGSAHPVTGGIVSGASTKSRTRNTILSVLSGIVLIALFAGALIWWKKSRRQTSMVENGNTVMHAVENGSFSSYGPPQLNVSEQEEESPCLTHDVVGPLPLDSMDSASESVLESTENDCNKTKGQDKNGAGSTRPRRSSLVEIKRKFSRDHSYQALLGQDPEEPQGGGSARPRRPSLADIKRRFSKERNFEPLSGEDPEADEDTKNKKLMSTVAAESLEVQLEPDYQEQKEGARAEFKCNISRETKARYQWFKDASMMHGQRSSSLVFNPVKVMDYGNYKCQVKYGDGYSNCVESFPAELDVAPRDGMVYKCLRDIDVNIQERVGNLLTQKKPGLPETWKQLAYKYKMEKDVIGSLESSQEPAGKVVVDFLARTNPNLTVYEFCKYLKMPDIRRFDIVEELLGCLTTPVSSGNVHV